MPTCAGCGAPLAPSAQYCTQCGAPLPVWPSTPPAGLAAPVRGASWWPAGIAAAVSAIGAIAMIVTVLNSPKPVAATQPQPQVEAQVVAPTTTPETFDTAEPSPTTTVAVDPHTMLDQEVADDRATVESLDGSWVPQLSAKKPGLHANGMTYDYASIWQDFQEIKSRYPDAVLLWSGDYASFKSADFWITVEPDPSTAGADANAWCDAQGIGPDDCFAKLVSHSHGPSGATLPRPH